MGDEVQGLADVRQKTICCYSLICRTSYFITEGNQVCQRESFLYSSYCQGHLAKDTVPLFINVSCN